MLALKLRQELRGRFDAERFRQVSFCATKPSRGANFGP
jgi:hypothetical protein